MRLVKVGDAWVDPSVVVAVRRFGGPYILTLAGGYELSTGPCVATDEELAALLSPPPPAPARVVHPLALAYLEAERVNGLSGTTEEARRARLAYSDWRNADCPIWAEP